MSPHSADQLGNDTDGVEGRIIRRVTFDGGIGERFRELSDLISSFMLECDPAQGQVPLLVAKDTGRSD